MITLHYKDGQQQQLQHSEQLPASTDALVLVYGVDIKPAQLALLQDRFDLDLGIFSSLDDIELSSNYRSTPQQLTFNLSIPIFSELIQFEEEDFIIIIKDQLTFCFLSSDLRRSLSSYNPLDPSHLAAIEQDYWQVFFVQLALISDYYADLTELLTSKIRDLYMELLSKRQYLEKDLDFITILKLNNHLIRSSLNRFQRVLLLLEKNTLYVPNQEQLQLELQDLAVVAEHVQYNFERLDGLKDNINIKINLEQNKIFRTLTVITVCISLPTLIAGIYGMNFKYMPELDWPYGYGLVLGMMFLIFVGALGFFRWKKWIR